MTGSRCGRRLFFNGGNRKLFFLLGCGLDRAIAERTLFLAFRSRRFLRGGGVLGFDHREHRPDRNLIADFARELHHLAGHRRFHLDRRLVGHHVGDLLVL